MRKRQLESKPVQHVDTDLNRSGSWQRGSRKSLRNYCCSIETFLVRVWRSKVNRKSCAHIMHVVNNSTSLITHTTVVLTITLHHIFKCCYKKAAIRVRTVDDAIPILDEGIWGFREGQTFCFGELQKSDMLSFSKHGPSSCTQGSAVTSSVT